MSKVIHVFDLDDTLSITPDFVEFLDTADGQEIDISKNYPDYFRAVRAAFWDKLSKPAIFVRKGDFVVPVNKTTGKPFDGDTMNYFGERRYQRMFEVVNDVLTVRTFPGFHSDPNTIGKKINMPTHEEYQKAENRMILTGRDEKLRPQLEATLKELGIEYPNYGLKLYSGHEGIKNFKTRTILESIAENGWNEVHFYEDRKDWLRMAEETVKEKYPEVKFVPHFISNVRNQKKF
jgi:hypothetical protein